MPRTSVWPFQQSLASSSAVRSGSRTVKAARSVVSRVSAGLSSKEDQCASSSPSSSRLSEQQRSSAGSSARGKDTVTVAVGLSGVSVSASGRTSSTQSASAIGGAGASVSGGRVSAGSVVTATVSAGRVPVAVRVDVGAALVGWPGSACTVWQPVSSRSRNRIQSSFFINTKIHSKKFVFVIIYNNLRSGKRKSDVFAVWRRKMSKKADFSRKKG